MLINVFLADILVSPIICQYYLLKVTEKGQDKIMYISNGTVTEIFTHNYVFSIPLKYWQITGLTRIRRSEIGGDSTAAEESTGHVYRGWVSNNKNIESNFWDSKSNCFRHTPPLFSTYIQNSEGVGPWHKLDYARHCSQAMAGLVRLDHYGSRARASLIKMALRVEPA